MASAEAVAEPVGSKQKVALPMVPLMLAVVTAATVAVGGFGGAAYWLVKSGRLPLGGVTKIEVVEQPKPVTHLVALEPLLVNLADTGGRSYLRVAITLRVEDPPVTDKKAKKEEEPAKGKAVNEFEAAERDAVLGVAGRETGAALLEADGKERLKAEVKAALVAKVPEVKVADVLFTEFLVQQ